MYDYQAQQEAVEQFADALADAGLLLKGLPIMDGRLHHVPTLGAKTKTDNAGVYIGHLDGGVPAGWFNNYRVDPSGEGQKWKASGITDTRSAAEIQRAKEEAERRRAQEEQKRAEQEERIARWADRKWNRCALATTHPYLERKGVAAHGLRVNEKNQLVVPMRDLSGKIWSLQTISPDGEKHYTSGGRKKGLHTTVGTSDPAKPLVFAEGFATAASIHEATGLPVAVIFDSGNLKPVAEAYRAHNVVQQLVFAADNDHHLPLKQSASGRPMRNVGVEKAQEAAQSVNGSVVIPAFERENSGTDWNNYATQHGLAAVREAFAGVSRVTPEVTATPAVAKPETKSTDRRVQEQEVSMSEQKSTSLAGVTEAGQVGVGEAQPSRENLHRKPDRAGQPSNRSTAAADVPVEEKPLGQLTRKGVEHALQSGASLAQKDLSGLDLSNLKFDGVNLAGSNLSGTRNINTTYESSRLDGANFSDAVFRNSAIDHVFAVNSRWDRAQFDQTTIVFSNFGNASFRDATFRDIERAREREEPPRKQAHGGEGGDTRAAEAIREPGRAGWSEVAAGAEAFLRDIGTALKDVSAQVYQKVRDWWTQPLQLAPEIDRNSPAAWPVQPAAYSAYEQPPAWAAHQTDRAQTQSYADANAQWRPNKETLRAHEVEKRRQEAPASHQNTEAKSNERVDGRSISTNGSAGPERVPPALIARNNFQFADLTGARFESIRVQDNDFRHAVLTNAHFPAELRESNTVVRDVEARGNRREGARASVKEAAEPIRQPKTEDERKQDRAELVETIRRDIDSREQKLRDGDSGLYRDTDALHLAKEMLRQVEAGADRIDLATAYKAADEPAAEERHVRAYNALNPLIAEAYAKGITVDRGSASLERAQAITDEAARLHDDVNASKNVQDRKELVAETKNLEAESVSLRTEGEANDEIRAELDREGITPLITMQQDRFDALLSVGVFDFGKSPEWRREMDQKISDRFAGLSSESTVNGKDQRTLWFEAAKQVQQGESLTQNGRDAATQDRGRKIEDQMQKHEVRRAVALAR